MESGKKWLVQLFSLGIGYLIHGFYRLKKWAKQSPREAVLILFVFTSHIFILTLVTMKKQPFYTKKIPSNLTVSTIITPPTPKVTITPVKKRAPQKKIVKKKTELLQNIEKSLSKMDKQKTQTREKKKPNVPSQAAVKNAQVNHLAEYQSVLISYLREVLTLPNIGEIKVKLIVSDAGKIASFEILSSTSEENENYLKNKLPFLSVPCFNVGVVNSKELPFLITFCGE